MHSLVHGNAFSLAIPLQLKQVKVLSIVIKVISHLIISSDSKT